MLIKNIPIKDIYRESCLSIKEDSLPKRGSGFIPQNPYDSLLPCVTTVCYYSYADYDAPSGFGEISLPRMLHIHACMQTLYINL